MLSATPKSQEVEVSERVEEKICEDRISALPNDLLVHILLFVPTKDVVATMILSKRWQPIWTAVPRLEYNDIREINNAEKESVWFFLDKSLHLHKAPILERLCIRLGESCPIDADVTKWVANAVDRCVRELVFELEWSAKPTSMPHSLYTCETLIELKLSQKVLLDVPSSACLPSLTKLFLCHVVYKDEVSITRLLSSCPVLKMLLVYRLSQEDDNVKTYSVKVPSLDEFRYINARSHGNESGQSSVVIDCPALTYIFMHDTSGDSCSIGKMPHLEQMSENVPLLWSKPDHVPKCLETHLEVFKIISYEGGKEEKEFVEYMLANSRCLKEAEILLSGYTSLEEDKKMIQELNSMFKISPSCRLTFY
ncbi:unnamed protein product [Microthlaspi erraticum]|uniref:F-box domain-containing protein n=1 Tax=Microthlaspi erraticum TaxID=1685480 RepID=A0A6D2L241_9BRAS|nr:unnamed protein product [Microthlaspi erraticum]